MLIKMSANTWSLIGTSLRWMTQSDMLGVAEVNRVVDRNIYTILECEEEAERESESCDSSWTSFKLDEEVGLLDPKSSDEKNEKKIDVYKIMKEYVKKHRNKYPSI
jgi:hypothetical protein